MYQETVKGTQSKTAFLRVLCLLYIYNKPFMLNLQLLHKGKTFQDRNVLTLSELTCFLLLGLAHHVCKQDCLNQDFVCCHNTA